MAEFEKSIVGDPVQWNGLVYAPINISGLIYALGTLASATGFIFEEFSISGKTAICRRKTELGWEKVRIGFAVRSSDFQGGADEIDLLVCWTDDVGGQGIPPRLELSKFQENETEKVQGISPFSISRSAAENIREEFLAGNEVREDFEETIRQLDSRIKKLKNQ